MPLYEYECGECGARFTKLQNIDAPVPTCPECGSEQVKKMISIFAARTTPKAQIPPGATARKVLEDADIVGACSQIAPGTYVVTSDQGAITDAQATEAANVANMTGSKFLLLGQQLPPKSKMH